MSYQHALSQYALGMDSGLPLPIAVPLPSCPEQEVNASTVQAAAEVCGLLRRHGVPGIVLGSVSSERHLGPAYVGRALHDVDIAIPSSLNDACKTILREAGFTAWNEREILATVRNSGGGFGRVHNEGAASDKYVNRDTGLPIWFGFFCYDETERGVLFHEYYTVSRTKVEAAAKWLLGQNVRPATKQALRHLLPLPFDIAVFAELEQLFSNEGQSFWQQLFQPELNQQDIARRQSMSATHPDQLFEIKMKKQYTVPADAYFKAKEVEAGALSMPIFSLEGGYWPMKRFHPHYLGTREKYTLSSAMIERSGLLDDARLREYEAMYTDREITHTPIRTLDFTYDRIQDPALFRRQTSVSAVRNDEVFYPALLFEAVHLKRK